MTEEPWFSWEKTAVMSPPLEVPLVAGGGGGAGGPRSLSKVGRGGGGGGAEALFAGEDGTPHWICRRASMASMPSLLFHVRPPGKCCLIYAMRALKIR